MRRAALAAVAVWLAAIGAAAPAPAQPAKHGARDLHGLPSRAEAVAALHRAQRLRAGRGGGSGRELSPVLARVAAGLPQLTGSDRAEAEALLARPDDGDTDPTGTHKWSGPEDPKSPWCVAHFCIHWAKTGVDAPASTPDANNNQVPDSIEQMADIFENEVHPCENGTAPNACAITPGSGGAAPGLGWREPAPDGGRGGDDRTDIYIEDLFPAKIFGFVAPDPGQPQDPGVPHHAYMVMDKDYARYAGGDQAEGVADERVTAAHEYNHVLQNGYDYLEDQWMFESTAVWMEDKVYPGINDYLRYVDDWVTRPGQPLTTFSDENLKPYGSAVWNHWLDGRYGAATVRAAWESSVASANLAPAAYNAAIAGAKGAGFSDEFDRFAAAASEWRAPGSGFPDSYPDVSRSGTLPLGTVTNPFSLAHTGFSLFDVPVPAGAPVIRLMVTLPQGTAGGVALVGRTGSDPAGGTVTSNVAPLPNGGVGAVTLNDPGSFGRITAVVANSDFAVSGFDQAANDYVFTHDAPSVTAQLDGPGPPFPSTAGALTVGDHTATVAGSVDPRLQDTQWAVEYGKTITYGTRTPLQQIAGTVIVPPTVLATLPGLDARSVYHYRLIASNASGQVVGNDMTFTTARDVTRPLLALSVPRRQRAARFRLEAKVDERVVGSVRIEIGRRTARKLGLPTVLAKRTLRLPARTRLTTVKVRIPRRVVKRLSIIRQVRATLRAAVADASRNTRVARRGVVVTR